MTGDPSDPSNASAPPDLGAFELDFPEPEPVPAAREEDAVASPGLDAIELPEGDDEDSWGALPDLELEDIGPPPAASPVAPAPAAAPPPAASVAASTATSRVAEPMEQPTIETRAARALDRMSATARIAMLALVVVAFLGLLALFAATAR